MTSPAPVSRVPSSASLDSARECPQLLPSAESAIRFARGEPGSFGKILFCTIGRLAVVAPASVLVGVHLGAKPKTALAIAGAAVLSIEVFVLALAYAAERENSSQSRQALGRFAHVPNGACPHALRRGALSRRLQGESNQG